MGVAKRRKIWFNKEMSLNNDGSPAQATAPASEVEGLGRLVEEQKKLIQAHWTGIDLRCISTTNAEYRSL
jgi:hypothetical protein